MVHGHDAVGDGGSDINAYDNVAVCRDVSMMVATLLIDVVVGLDSGMRGSEAVRPDAAATPRPAVNWLRAYGG